MSRFSSSRVLAIVFAGVSLTAFAPPPQDAFVGRWTFDAARSDLQNDLVLTPTADGRMHSEGGTTAAYDFAIDGGDSRTANGRIVNWRSTGPRAWTMTKSRDGEVVETTAVSLSEDGKTLITDASGSLPDGSPFTRKTTYRRDEGGPSLLGRWRSVDVDNGVIWDGYEISRLPSGDMVWAVPTDQQTITGPFDGSDLPIVGPGLPPGATIAVRLVSDRELAVTMKTAGEVSEQGTVTVSADGRILTERFWAPGHEDRASRIVHVREP